MQSSAYREHKVRTMIDTMPELIGPDAEPFDLRFSGQDGRAHDTAALVLVANNPYLIDRDRNTARGATSTEACSGSSPSRGRRQAACRSGRPRRFASTPVRPSRFGIDGESVAMEPPLVFKSDPRKLRMLVPARRRPDVPRLVRATGEGARGETGRSAVMVEAAAEAAAERIRSWLWVSGPQRCAGAPPTGENHGLAVVDGASKDHRQRLVEAELEDFDVLALVRLAATL